MVNLVYFVIGGAIKDYVKLLKYAIETVRQNNKVDIIGYV